MRIRIILRPSGVVEEVSLERFHIGEIYEVGSHLGCVFLAEGWAELVGDDGAAVFPSQHDVTPTNDAALGPLVLVVDDDAAVRRLAGTVLTAHGYRVVLAAHGREAIQHLREHCPDLIVLDLNMPIMDGWNFRTEQRFLGGAAIAPVLLMSGDPDADASVAEIGAVALIKKPFDLDDLLEAVSAAIGSQQSAPDGIRSPRPNARRTRRPA